MKKVTAAQLMSRKILAVSPDWSVERLMGFLTDHRISGAPVIGDDGKPIGVVSHTDIARNGALTSPRGRPEDHALYRSPEDAASAEELARARLAAGSAAKVRDIMTPMIFAVDVGDTVQEVAEMMITGRIHRVFVSEAGKLTGVITSMDLLPIIRGM